VNVYKYSTVSSNFEFSQNISVPYAYNARFFQDETVVLLTIMEMLGPMQVYLFNNATQNLSYLQSISIPAMNAFSIVADSRRYLIVTGASSVARLLAWNHAEQQLSVESDFTIPSTAGRGYAFSFNDVAYFTLTSWASQPGLSVYTWNSSLVSFELTQQLGSQVLAYVVTDVAINDQSYIACASSAHGGSTELFEISLPTDQTRTKTPDSVALLGAILFIVVAGIGIIVWVAMYLEKRLKLRSRYRRLMGENTDTVVVTHIVSLSDLTDEYDDEEDSHQHQREAESSI
jgi:hypothetical protein